MKAKRDRIAVALVKLVEKMGLDEALKSLFWQFEDDDELASMLRDGYVAGYRMVLNDNSDYVDADKFPFAHKIADVRAKWIAERRASSASYIEWLRKRVEDGAEQERAHLESAIKCFDIDFPEQKKAS